MKITGPDGVEIAVLRHTAREGWDVLRVTYPRRPEFQSRIIRAIDVLLGTSEDNNAPPDPSDAPGAGGSEAEQVK